MICCRPKAVRRRVMDVVSKCCARPRLDGFVLVRFLSSWLDPLVAERSAHPKDFYCNLQHTLSLTRAHAYIPFVHSRTMFYMFQVERSTIPNNILECKVSGCIPLNRVSLCLLRRPLPVPTPSSCSSRHPHRPFPTPTLFQLLPRRRLCSPHPNFPSPLVSTPNQLP